MYNNPPNQKEEGKFSLSKREHNENLFYSFCVFSAGEKSQMNSPKHITSLADATWAAQASSNCPANVTQF